ncbi:UDP-N-acetyl-D-mannosamine dehydrogenase [Chlorobium phaeovibrioides]|uniref:UDP-N-acetyl-D-mannosamine dehydrogenase n=1 Tax=Chlorobium phaeovibrioides TaxID=1094 RepID=A0A432ASX3_CHLPH|nr:UDP-N-acetyl-D-mannosamine dehydrogenase [Chlorobium phaeovibrioides]RTY35903.1 UDP-N-acetyl-D-mannosamine dehydrogenase [Chlorobium phaeovibrioides]
MLVQFFGLGYIGLPTAAVLAGKGVRVHGVDVNPDVVETIQRGEIHIVEPGLAEVVKEGVLKGDFTASTSPLSADVHLVVVPTPFKGAHEPDISFVESATRMVLPLLKEEDTFIIESTSPVGTTEQMAALIFFERPELEGKVSIAYCPERVLPGNVLHELVHNDRVIGGIDEQSTEKAKEFYRLFVEGELHGTNARTAELCKLTENSSRDVQIAFANELSLICDRAGINVWELVELANRHPRVNILKPGAGVGGHCIAVDPWFIVSDYPKESRLIGTARDINNYKAFWCAEKIRSSMLEFELRHGRKPRVALMGLAFKPNIDDLRESPAKYIVQKVMQSGQDGFLVVEPNIDEHGVFKLTEYREAYDRADIVAFLVAHDEFHSLDYDNEKAILDFAGVFRR